MKSVLLILTTFLVTNAMTQPIFEWATQTGGTGDDWAFSIATDASGNVYSTGRFSGTVDFDPGTGVANLSSNGGLDIFVMKQDVNGNLLWARSIGGTSTDRGESITIDLNGDVLVTGDFSSSADFDPGAGIVNLTSNGNSDFFVLKLNSNGDFIWVTQTGGLYGDKSESVITDASGNVYATGYFGNTVDFDPGVGIFNMTAGSREMFVQKLDVNGNFIWAKHLDGNDTGYSKSNAIDAFGNVYILGYFYGTLDVDPGVGVTNLNSLGGNDVFILKLNANGDFVWGKQISGIDNIQADGIQIDANGNVCVSGSFNGTVDFDPGIGTYNETVTSGMGFILKLNDLGIFQWVNVVGGLYGNSLAIDVDSNGNIFSTGTFQGTADFDPGVGVYNVTSSGGNDIYVLKYDLNGNFIWVETMGGASQEGGYSIEVFADSYIYTNGYFSGTADFNPGVGVTSYTSNGLKDIFVNKLYECIPTTGTDVQNACNTFDWIDGITYTSSNNTATHTLTNAAGCDSVVTLDLAINYSNTGTDVQTACDTYDWIDGNTYTASNNTATHILTNTAGCDSVVTLDLTVNYSNTGTDVRSACNSFDWIDGNTYTSSNNTATHTLTNAAGCDSVVTLDLTINPLPDNNLTQTGSLLEADQTGANYQWLDCDDNYAIISGETNQAYIPTPVTGNYAVEVTLNGCADTSACFLVDYTGLSEMYAEIVSIHPNPTLDVLMITGLNEITGLKGMEITSSTGEVVQRYEGVNEELNVSELPTGVYFLNILHEEGIETMRFVKQ